ncbi:MAG TPA: prolipoprotein diacylglyceryl transferase [Firmicutes bacterium]|nr:prolipoprotein diacylglyceryl transferase [Bacillota bacterium]
MRPILFQVWGMSVFSYGFMIAVAFIAGTALGVREARKRGIETEKVIDLALYLCISGIVGARLVYVLLDLPAYLEEPLEVLRLRDGGLSFHGGLFAAILVGIWFCKRSGVNPWVMADVAAPSIALGYSIARVGCFLNGCCYGLASNLPWAIACAAGDVTRRHPTQIYAALGSLAIFAILMRMRDHKRFPGYLMFLYVGLYSILRFVVEIFRDVPRFIGPLSIAQVASIIVGLAAFASIYLLSEDPGRKAGRTLSGPHVHGQGRS